MAKGEMVCTRKGNTYVGDEGGGGNGGEDIVNSDGNPEDDVEKTQGSDKVPRGEHKKPLNGINLFLITKSASESTFECVSVRQSGGSTHAGTGKHAPSIVD